MRLPHAHRQALAKGGAHGHFVHQAAIDARNRNCAAFTAGLNRIAQRIGTIRFQIEHSLGFIIKVI